MEMELVNHPTSPQEAQPSNKGQRALPLTEAEVVTQGTVPQGEMPMLANIGPDAPSLLPSFAATNTRTDDEETRNQASDAPTPTPKPTPPNGAAAAAAAAAPSPTVPPPPQDNSTAKLIPELALAMRAANLDPDVLERATRSQNEVPQWTDDYQRRMLHDISFLQQEMGKECTALSVSLSNASTWLGNATAWVGSISSLRAYYLLELWLKRRNERNSLPLPFDLARDLLFRAYDHARQPPRVDNRWRNGGPRRDNTPRVGMDGVLYPPVAPPFGRRGGVVSQRRKEQNRLAQRRFREKQREKALLARRQLEERVMADDEEDESLKRQLAQAEGELEGVPEAGEAGEAAARSPPTQEDA